MAAGRRGAALRCPYLAGERTPHADPDARGAFVGLQLRHDRGALVRAVLEGVAFGLRDSLDLLRELGVERGRRARLRRRRAEPALAARSSPPCSTSRSSGRTSEEGRRSAPRCSAASPAACSRDVAGGRRRAASASRETIEPDPHVARDAYAELHARYRALYPALHPVRVAPMRLGLLSTAKINARSSTARPRAISSTSSPSAAATARARRRTRAEHGIPTRARRRTRRCSPTTSSTRSTSRCRTACTTSGRCARSRPASTSCARSRTRAHPARGRGDVRRRRAGRAACSSRRSCTATHPQTKELEPLVREGAIGGCRSSHAASCFPLADLDGTSASTPSSPAAR